MHNICDGVKNCPNGDDELHCVHSDHCPPACRCTGQVVVCHGELFDGNWTNLHNQIRKLDLSGAKLQLLPQSYFESLRSNFHFLGSLNLSNSGLKMVPRFPKMPNLYALDLSYNNITKLVNRTFATLANLKYLKISNNPFLECIAKYSFVNLGKLLLLDLSNTALRHLTKKMFENLNNLLHLNLSDSQIVSVADNTFYNLHQLRVLDITNNPIELFHSNMFSGLESMEHLYSPSFKFCCKALWPGHSMDSDDCHALEDSISSCKNLMQRSILRLFLWILGICALMGNIVVVSYQHFFNKRFVGRTYSVFVTNLGISDFCMGIYMIIISAADVKYRGTYLWHELDWRNGIICKMAGFLATLSSEASIVFVCLITTDRFLVIRFPFGQIRFRRHSAITTAIIVWVVVIVVATIPLIPPMDQWALYSQNGVCLPLPLSTEQRPGWQFTTSIFIGFNFLAFLFIAVGQIAIYKSMMNTSVLRDKVRTAQEMRVARRLSLIVLTDFICWFPVCLMGLLALSGTEIGGEVYAWTAVFILPVNSALNPFLYTIPSLLRRRGKDELAFLSQFSPVLRLSRIRRRSFSPDVKFVYAGYPAPNMKSFHDLIKQRMLTPDQIQDLCGYILASLPSLNIRSSGSKHVKIFVKMNGNVLSKVCLNIVDSAADDQEGIEYGISAVLNNLHYNSTDVTSNGDGC
ncbi:G-protein coupled receptor GRL101-like [Gigantopelta aegis]|uniref:G-protein coupled receptor GRL101-like n=1 Tax=Gigantopelta aegis TaxID=1735272 RepID=UPI001B88D4A0|nr:G-protein coupled receptor GRL101-like [Gigantopelta aegis]